MYQAPMYHCEEDIVPNSYIVFLSPGVSLEQHKRSVGPGADLDSAISRVHDNWDPNRIIYSADLEDGPLAAVRVDTGVDLIECNARVHIAVGL